MSTIPALITEARRIVERHGMTQSTILIDRLADALEAEHKRAEELEAIVNDGGNQAAKYWTRLTAAEREADRFRAAIKAALHHAPGLGELRWRKVDQMIGVLRGALSNEAPGV